MNPSVVSPAQSSCQTQEAVPFSARLSLQKSLLTRPRLKNPDVMELRQLGTFLLVSAGMDPGAIYFMTAKPANSR
jgi:hypothetical protein